MENNPIIKRHTTVRMVGKTHDRMAAWLDEQNQRPGEKKISIPDLLDTAINEYLDRKGFPKN